MKKSLILALGLLVVASAGYATGTAWGASPSPYLGVPIVANSGSITGTVTCGCKGPKAWATVWVQGHSFSARTDDEGVFVIDYVPPGEYMLGVQTAGMPIRGCFPVTVFPRATAIAGDEEGVLHVTGGCGGDTGGCDGASGGGCGEEGGGCGGDTGGCGEEGGGCGEEGGDTGGCGDCSG